MTWAEALPIVTTASSGILIPIILYIVGRQALLRTSSHTSLHERLDHIDACIDALRDRVVGEMATRTELEAVRDRAAIELQKFDLAQNQARHDNNDRTAALLVSIEDRLTRRIEVLEETARGNQSSRGH